MRFLIKSLSILTDDISENDLPLIQNGIKNQQNNNKLMYPKQPPPPNYNQSEPFIYPHSMQNVNSANDQVPIKRIQDYSYFLSDKLGLGMTAHVYKGRNQKTGKKVAVKVIDINSTDQLSQALINEEIKTLEKIKTSSLVYKNLLKLQEVLRTKNHLYIITEFCEGKDMGKILRQKKSLKESQAQTVMKQLINGYRQLYSLGIIHRDLKLSNIFVTNNLIKLADFGFAIGQDKCDLSLGYNVGTPHYMAPETLKYNKYSIKGDIWSLGIIAYEIIYGKPPYKDKIDANLYELINNVPIQHLFDPSVPVSNEYKNFIYQCLQLDPAARPSPEQIFNYNWPQSVIFVEGFEEQVKVPEVIKVPGHNYAVYRNSNKQISYESKQMDVNDFKIDPSQPTQSIVLGQLSYCKFLAHLYDILKQNQQNPLVAPLVKELVITLQTKMKKLAKLVRGEKNQFQTQDFQAYCQTADWQNIKQIIVRYDIQFRNQLKKEQPLSKFAEIPYTPALGQLVQGMKKQLPNNWRLLAKLVSYLQIRNISKKLNELSFSQAVNFERLLKDLMMPDEAFDVQSQLTSLGQRIQRLGL